MNFGCLTREKHPKSEKVTKFFCCFPPLVFASGSFVGDGLSASRSSRSSATGRLPRSEDFPKTPTKNLERHLLVNRFLPGGRGADRADLCLDRAMLTEMLQTAEGICREANTLGSIGTELPRCVIEGQYRMLTVGTCCAGGVDFFAIDPACRVRPCNHSPVTLGTWHDLPAAIANPYWQRLKKEQSLPAPCRDCAQSLECDGGFWEAAHIVGGALDSPDPMLMPAADPDQGRVATWSFVNIVFWFVIARRPEADEAICSHVHGIASSPVARRLLHDACFTTIRSSQ
jgi:radical SAM protein with 4Fe4S-binding SPASM domain